MQPEIWTHLAVGKSGGWGSGWVNGRKVGAVPDMGGGVQNFAIGATAPGKESFTGWVAEVRSSTFQPDKFDPSRGQSIVSAHASCIRAANKPVA